MVSFAERLNEDQQDWLWSTPEPLRSLTFEPFDADSQRVLEQV